MSWSSKRAAIVAALLALGLILPASSMARPRPPNLIPQGLRDSLYIKDVVIDWQVDESKSAGDLEFANHKAEMIQSVTSAIRSQFQYTPAGPDAADLRIRITSFHRNEVVGTVEVVRLSDQQVLGVYEKLEGHYIGLASGGGLMGVVIGLSSVPDATPAAALCFAAVLRARFNDLDLPRCEGM